MEGHELVSNWEPDSPRCDPACISGPQLKAALEILGLWFGGQILSVKISARPGGVVMYGHPSPWYAEAEVCPSSGPSCDGIPVRPYETRLIRVPVHVGPTMMQRWREEVQRHG
jgi:hypothetical protein